MTLPRALDWSILRRYYARALPVIFRSRILLPGYSLSVISSRPLTTTAYQAAVEPAETEIPPLILDGRQRLSNFLAPTGGITAASTNGQEDTHSLLVRAGFLRQAHSGIFHLLPLGLRVHDKIERLIDKHMRALGASKLALSTISSQSLWSKTGRLDKGGAELFKFEDRKGSKYLLSPTHEEEITSLVASLVTSYKQLPLRAYQISRKYRDERRPRAGLLRGREFTMKDLYTFDVNESSALATYYRVIQQYKNLFSDLKMPYLMSEAESGNMGGNLSHEFHYPSPTGEDIVVYCTNCDYSANEACARTRSPKPNVDEDSPIGVFHGISKDRKTLINVFYPRTREPPIGPEKEIEDAIEEDSKLNEPLKQEGVHTNEVNPHRVKELVPEYDPAVQNPVELFGHNFIEYDPELHKKGGYENDPNIRKPYSQIINIYDGHLATSLLDSPTLSNHYFAKNHRNETFFASKDIPTTTITRHPDTNDVLNLLKIRQGDLCPKCTAGSLTLTNCIELGHTFYLSHRYSAPLSATVENEENKIVPMEMGCHGIGLSRTIAALAEEYRDGKGLSWPRIVAPFEICLVTGWDAGSNFTQDGVSVEDVYDMLSESNIDSVVDDRKGKSLPWKMKDADLIGYPLIIVLGRKWHEFGEVEVQCRRKGVKENVPLSKLRKFVADLLGEL